MLRLRDIMTTDVATVSPQTTIREAMELLGQRHLSGAPVVAGGTVVGIVSATDLMMFAAALSGIPTDNGMSDDLGDVIEPPVEDEMEQESEAIGAEFADLWDEGGAEVTGRFAFTNGPEWNVLEEHDISEVMTRTPLRTLPPDAMVSEAAEIMKADGIHRILVTDNGRLAGIVSTLDITRAVADHQLTSRVYVFNNDQEFNAAG